MSIFVDENGFIKKTYEDNKTYYEGVFQAIFGNDIDLDVTGPFGQMVAQFSKRDTDIWDGAEEIYNSRNPFELQNHRYRRLAYRATRF